MNLLGTSVKVLKGEKLGIATGVLYLSPANESGANLCPASTAGCRAACLGHSSGHMSMPTHKAARIRKSELLRRSRPAFLELLRLDIAALQRRADRLGYQAAVRLNGSSDIGWEHPNLARSIFDEFPRVHFYDYSKRYARVVASLSGGDWPTNYRLTFSRSGENWPQCEDVLKRGGSVAAVFGPSLSYMWGDDTGKFWDGWPVVSGENSDYRYGDPGGHVIALKARGKALRDRSGFVIHAD